MVGRCLRLPRLADPRPHGPLLTASRPPGPAYKRVISAACRRTGALSSHGDAHALAYRSKLRPPAVMMDAVRLEPPTCALHTEALGTFVMRISARSALRGLPTGLSVLLALMVAGCG